MNGLSDHELFVFGPGKCRGHAFRGFGVSVRASRVHQQPANQAVKRLERRKLLTALIGRKHGFKGISGGENDFRETGAVFVGDLRSEDVLQFVGKFA